MGGYAVQALWSQADGKAVIPTSLSGAPLAVGGAPLPASAGPLRSMVTTVRGADPQATRTGFMALFHGNDSLSASSPMRSQGQPALLAVPSPGIPAVLPSGAITAVAAIPPGSPEAMSLRGWQEAATDSRGADNLSSNLEDELPAAGSIVPRGEAFPAPAVPGFEQDVVPAVQSDAGLWREASTAYFAQQGAASGSAERGVPAPMPLAVPDGSAGSPGAAAAALALVLGSYWKPPYHESTVRKRSGLTRSRGSR